MTKQELRDHYLQKRNQFSDDEFLDLNAVLTNKLLASIEKKAPKCVFVFLPIDNKKEFNTYPLINELWQRNIATVVPVSDFKTSEMQLAVYEKDTVLIQKKYGILEPQSSVFVHPSEVQLAVVPLLVHDRKMNRIGYGGGFYDRFFNKNPNFYKLGVSFFEPIDEIAKLEETDVSLDEVVHPF